MNISKFVTTLTKGVKTFSPSCKQAARLQSEALDRTLSASERFGLRVHLLLCKWCRRYGRHLSFLRSAAHEWDETQSAEAPQRLSPEAREGINQSIRSRQK